MPKEKIHPRTHGTDEHPHPWAELSWNNEAGYVQLVVKNQDGIALEPTPECNGWAMDLDRYGINALIRYLRRARDGAFGKDE